jgi:hypothetical protein
MRKFFNGTEWKVGAGVHFSLFEIFWQLDVELCMLQGFSL